MPAAALLRGYIELTNFMFELERQRLGCWKDLRWYFSVLRCLPQRNDIFAQHWPKWPGRRPCFAARSINLSLPGRFLRRQVTVKARNVLFFLEFLHSIQAINASRATKKTCSKTCS